MFSAVKTLSVTKAIRNFRKVIDSVEYRQEEIILMRNGKPVARLIPESPSQDALEVFGNLHRTLDKKTARALSTAISINQKSRR